MCHQQLQRETMVAMTQPARQSRRKFLEDFLSKNPDDAFARYGLAMEHVAQDDWQEAEQHFRLLLATHPDYVAGYYHLGQLLVRAGRLDEAKEVLMNGVVAARTAGNSHALAEMEQALAEISN
jgi:predicted Zn-dependent protease